MQLRRIPLLVLVVIACTRCTGVTGDPERAVGWPRIHVEQASRHHGDYSGWTVDEQGNYFTRSKGSAGGNSSTYTRCTGTVPRTLVAPWIQQIRQWNTTADEAQARPDDSPEHSSPTLEYHETEGQRRFPADDAAMQARRELARQVFDAMPEHDDARCTKSERGY